MKLEGMFAALTTPFRADDSLDLAALAENVARYNRTDLAGYVVTGSTGEAALLTSDESERVWATVLEHTAASKTAIAGTGTETTAEAIARTRRAAAIGYAAALVRTPSYYKPFMHGDTLIEHYRRVADASPIPILIYSVPIFTGVTVEADVTARLAEHPNIIGIKDSSGSVERVAQTARAVPASFSVRPPPWSRRSALAQRAVSWRWPPRCPTIALRFISPCEPARSMKRARWSKSSSPLRERSLRPSGLPASSTPWTASAIAADCRAARFCLRAKRRRPTWTRSSPPGSAFPSPRAPRSLRGVVREKARFRHIRADLLNPAVPSDIKILPIAEQVCRACRAHIS
jgi:hypothetical protein